MNQTNPQARILTLERQLAKLKQELVTDELTKVYNRRGLIDALTIVTREVAYQLQHPDKRRNVVIRSLSVIFIDIDNFKEINSRYGHQGGDIALSTVAQAVKNRLRGIDVIGRYGGEEFVVGLVGADIANATHIAEDIRTNIAQTAIHANGEEFFVTISCGVAPLTVDCSLEQLLRHADTALLQAKQQGRNKVVVHGQR